MKIRGVKKFKNNRPWTWKNDRPNWQFQNLGVSFGGYATPWRFQPLCRVKSTPECSLTERILLYIKSLRLSGGLFKLHSKTHNRFHSDASSSEAYGWPRPGLKFSADSRIEWTSFRWIRSLYLVHRSRRCGGFFAVKTRKLKRRSDLEILEGSRRRRATLRLKMKVFAREARGGGGEGDGSPTTGWKTLSYDQTENRVVRSSSNSTTTTIWRSVRCSVHCCHD